MSRAFSITACRRQGCLREIRKIRNRHGATAEQFARGAAVAPLIWTHASTRASSVLLICLIISADPAYVSTLQSGLKGHGVKLYGTRDLGSVRLSLKQWRFDAVLCDAQGIAAELLADTVRSLRREQRAPIVVLAPPGSEEGGIAPLEAGATELMARTASARLIALQLQRLVDLAAGASEPEPFAVSIGGLRLDPRREEAVFGNRALPLTGGEFELLLLLAARPDGFVHRDTIRRRLGRTSPGDARRSADMHVCRIRRKLREAGASSLALETVYGHGYALRLRNDAVDEALV
jgi:two-component system, OmpR family, response regulator CpxR